MRTTILSALILLCAAGPAQAIILYQGADNTTPDAQDWSYYPTGSATHSAAGGVTTLISAQSDYAGYAAHVIATIFSIPTEYTHRDLPTPFNRTTGYTVRFNVKLNSESHANTNRAGFSVIALSSDKVGVELGFWTDTIFAQNDSAAGQFTHGEDVAFATTSMHQYDLAILGNQYKLFVDGAQQLSGNLRDYSSPPTVVTLGPVSMEPYNTPNYLFLGDDTTSAGPSIDLALVEMLPYAVPEPGSLMLLGLGGVAFVVTARRRRTTR